MIEAIRTKIFRPFHVVYAIILMVAFTFCTYLYWTYRPYRVITISKFEIVTQPARQGDALVFELTYCEDERYANDKISAQYTFTDEINYPRAPVVWSHLQGGCHTRREAIPTPHVPPASYELNIELSYQVNPVREVVLRAKSAKFEILPPLNPIAALSPQLMELHIISGQLRQLISENENLRGANQSLRGAINELIAANAKAVDALPRVPPKQ